MQSVWMYLFFASLGLLWVCYHYHRKSLNTQAITYAQKFAKQQAEFQKWKLISTYAREHKREASVAMFVHEVSQPLTSMLGAIRFAQLRYKDNALDLDGAMDSINQASESAFRQKSLIETMRSERYSVPEPIKATNLLQAVMDAIEFLGNDVDQTRVKLVIDVPADEPVMAPPIGLTVALSCLIKNSMESMDGGSIMRVEFRAIRQTEDLVLVEIIDCGRGISEEMWAKVGHKMFSTKPSGVGFGLASAKWALKETGAGITIKSQGTGMGATASFTLARPISP